MTELVIPGSGREVVLRAATAFGLSPDDLTGRARYRRIVRARSAVVWILRRQLNADGLPKSYPQIGLLLGGRDHTTMIYCNQRCEKWMETDQKYRATVLALQAGLAPVYVRPALPDGTLAPVMRKLGPVSCVEDLPARQVKPKNELAWGDSSAVDRFNGSNALLAAIQRERGLVVA